MSAPDSQSDIRTAVETIVRDEWARVHSALIGHVRDFELAEDVLQDAVVAALRRWTEDGIPRSPRAWLLRTARRKAIDRFRRGANFEAKRAEYEVLVALDRQSRGHDDVDEAIPDERLRLFFTCCHPALAEPARVALTLRTIGGLTTAEIARAFLVTEDAMAQRIVRAKRKIRIAKIPYGVPEPSQLAERLGSVLSVIYLVFNEGYTDTGDGASRSDLCREAIRICRVLGDLMPGEPEVAGLLALMLLHEARRSARILDGGAMATLETQDRGSWNQEQIAEGLGILRLALGHGRSGPYQIQAAISAVHSEAESHQATDWNEIMLLYGRLYTLQPSPVVVLNAAVALSFARGAEAGLAALEELRQSGVLQGYQPYHAARADFLRRAGRHQAAKAEYDAAIDLARNASQRTFLENRRRELAG